jgi:hypothetical protein
MRQQHRVRPPRRRIRLPLGRVRASTSFPNALLGWAFPQPAPLTLDHKAKRIKIIGRKMDRSTSWFILGQDQPCCATLQMNPTVTLVVP